MKRIKETQVGERHSQSAEALAAWLGSTSEHSAWNAVQRQGNACAGCPAVGTQHLPQTQKKRQWESLRAHLEDQIKDPEVFKKGWNTHQGCTHGLLLVPQRHMGAGGLWLLSPLHKLSLPSSTSREKDETSSSCSRLWAGTREQTFHF